MKVKMILPALTESESPFWRPIKYSLFPPLGLATLAAYLSPDDEIDLHDQHVEKLTLLSDVRNHGKAVEETPALRNLRNLFLVLV
ncbi:MAG: hypothetical protein LBG15_02690 [Dysgonamonadaceae bacterium]|jgi:hypothetical protein|nr:hypothetical protein [Dysgonamonadaceae bacterium]